MSGPFKQKGWEAYTKVKNKPVKPSKTETGIVTEDTRPWKDDKGIWHYPKGYSGQKKYQERGQSRSSKSKRKTQ